MNHGPPSVCRWDQGNLILTTRVRPNAPRTKLTMHGEDLRLSVRCPPVEGRANREAVAALAKAFRVPRRRIELLSGERSRTKLFRIIKPARLPTIVESMLPPGK